MKAKSIIRKSGEAENFAVDRIIAENLQLHEILKKQTNELEHKNRQLEIETALEKVRIVALSMKEPADMLSVCRNISNQLQNLKVSDIRNIQTAIINEPKGIYLNYEYYRLHDKTFITEVDYSHPVQAAFVNQMMKDPEAFYTITFEGAELKDWFEYQKTTNQFADSFLAEASSLSYYWYSIGPVALGISTYSPLNEEDLEIFKRFRNVFELAYRRYNDLKIAEAHVVQAELDMVQLQSEKKRAENALKELKSTQSQLIQSEKMASLGELTAGIAHEIQNPLNFVNNFSEVNGELLVELKKELEKNNFDEVKSILDDITVNEAKINYHGKRADAIVKGMLEHSRTSSGQKEPTDINALADEFLRLAYYGLRAKDKSFNANFKIDPDENLQKVRVIPQEIGRVLLNMINNAFYAVAERAKHQEIGYKPAVSVSTLKLGDKIEIRIRDNGTGIPQNVLDKIFQPFFTTKSAGKGTGLGLSMSYDIIKAHGGQIKVETREGKGTDFIILLPF
jgi:signal transduction histidine kinase